MGIKVNIFLASYRSDLHYYGELIFAFFDDGWRADDSVLVGEFFTIDRDSAGFDQGASLRFGRSKAGTNQIFYKSGAQRCDWQN